MNETNMNRSVFLWLLIIIASVFAIIYLDRVVSVLQQIFPNSDLEIVSFNDRILFITLLALLRYAWATNRMKRAMVEQTDLEQTPIIDFYYRPETDEHEEYLRVRNSGKGVAHQAKRDI